MGAPQVSALVVDFETRMALCVVAHAGDEPARAAVRPAILLVHGDEVEGVRRVDVRARLDLRVWEEDAACRLLHIGSVRRARIERAMRALALPPPRLR
jgi:hypothetical protein